jgi:methyl coenzyme M reductase beta subunit
MILLHSTLNNFHLSHIVKDLKMKQMGDGFGRFELMSLLEPHKYRQNSVTMIRMTRHDPKSFLWADRLSDLLSAT